VFGSGIFLTLLNWNLELSCLYECFKNKKLTFLNIHKMEWESKNHMEVKNLKHARNPLAFLGNMIPMDEK